jgi:hypothetical protein
VERLVELVAHGGVPCVRRQLNLVHLLGDVHGRLLNKRQILISSGRLFCPLDGATDFRMGVPLAEKARTLFGGSNERFNLPARINERLP